MKRPLSEVSTGSVQSPVIDWTRQDRQPSWQEKQEEQLGLRVEDSDGDSDGDDFILESRRQQQRPQTPQRSDDDDKEAPGAPVKKKQRRVLPWTEEGYTKWPLASTYLFSCGPYDYGGVEDKDSDKVSETDDCAEDSETVGETEDSEEDRSEDDDSSFVVDDDSESVTEEENESEKSLGREALREVRMGIVEKIRKLKRQLKSVDEELGEFGDIEEDEDAAAKKISK
jgi:hypothetical protein